MKFRKLVIAMLCIPFIANAQAVNPFGNRGEIDVKNAYYPPRVFVPKVESTTEKGVVSGTFDAYNSEDFVVADLQYRIELLSPENPQGEIEVRDDSLFIYDTQVFPLDLTLLPLETKTVPFEYTLPTVPVGTYRMRISMTSSRGRDLGWFDSNITVSAPAATRFVSLVPGPFKISEYPDTVLTPLSGPNVSAGDTFEIQAEVSADRAITAIPVLEVHRFDVANPVIGNITGKAVSLTANNPSRFTLPVTAQKEAGVYYAVLRMQDSAGRTVSSLGPYRWVVRGASADILWTTMERVGYAAGDTVRLKFDFVGAPDAETTSDTTIAVTLTDDAGILGTIVEDGVTLTDKVRSGRFYFSLERDIQGIPVANVTITANDTELLSRSIPFTLSEEQLKTTAETTRASEKRLKIGAGLVAVGVIVFAYFWGTSRKRKRRGGKR